MKNELNVNFTATLLTHSQVGKQHQENFILLNAQAQATDERHASYWCVVSFVLFHFLSRISFRSCLTATAAFLLVCLPLNVLLWHFSAAVAVTYYIFTIRRLILNVNEALFVILSTFFLSFDTVFGFGLNLNEIIYLKKNRYFSINLAGALCVCIWQSSNSAIQRLCLLLYSPKHSHSLMWTYGGFRCGSCYASHMKCSIFERLYDESVFRVFRLVVYIS